MGVVWGCLLNERKVMTTKLIGHCGVDSGQILLIDPCYVYSDKFYDECCKVTLSEDKAGETTLGVVTSTYSGDGNYPVYATTDEHGGIMSVEIVFKKSDTHKIIIETTEDAVTNKEVEIALNDLNVALGDDLISWSESEEQTTDEDIQIHIETDEEYGRRVSQILESEEQ